MSRGIAYINTEQYGYGTVTAKWRDCIYGGLWYYLVASYLDADRKLLGVRAPGRH